jgi:hypothetical protein
LAGHETQLRGEVASLVEGRRAADRSD